MPKSRDNKSKPTADDDAVLSTQQAATQLGVSVRTVQLWVEAGMLVAWKTAGNHRRIYQWSVDELKSRGKSEQAAASAPSKPCILVVEDDRTTQAYYESMFQMLNLEHDLRFASDGLEGLVSLGRFKPWLLLLDIEMPRMNGIEMVQSIRQQALTKDTSMVIISNVAHSDAIKRGLPSDCTFFQKPISLSDLSTTVTNMIDKNQHKIEQDKK